MKLYFELNMIEVFLRGPIDHKPALIQVMARRQTDYKPLLELQLTQLTDAYVPH